MGPPHGQFAAAIRAAKRDRARIVGLSIHAFSKSVSMPFLLAFCRRIMVQ
jgi:hypothetical protein